MKGTDPELRREWEEVRKRQSQPRVKRQAAGEKARRGALANRLLKMEQWDWVLSELVDEIESRRQKLADIRARVFAAKVTSDAELRALRESGLVLEETLKLLEWLAELPKTAVEQGKTGLDKLRQVDADAASD